MKINILAIDLAKSSFQVRGVDEKGRVVLKKKLQRDELSEFVINLPQCRIVMEACGGAHYWARKFLAMGHKVDLIAAKFVKPFLKSQKNDDNDTEAIAEAASRPSMRYVAVKALAQQDIQCLHRSRENIVKSKTALVNHCRGLLMEYGVTINKSVEKFKSEMPFILESADNELTDIVRDLLQEQFSLFKNLLARQKDLENKIKAISQTQPDYKRLLEVPGVGELTASMFMSSVGDVNVFKNGRQLAAWAGLVPRQHSTGGKPHLLGITKAGDSHLRSLLIHGARALILAAVKKQKKDPYSQWILKLLDKKGWNITAVAIANRNCRVMWSLIKHQTDYKVAM